MGLSRRALLGAGLLGLAGCRRHAGRPSVAASPVRPSRQPPASHPAGRAAPPLGAQVAHGRRDLPRVALTFHGAGDPTLAVALLDAAERAGARITVLAVGRWLAAEPRMAGRILDGGHELGNHTYTHPVLSRLPAGAAYAEVARCADVLHRLTGSPGRWFRPSGTPHATVRIEAAARRAGYPTCLMYDVDPRDYADPGADAVRRRVLAAVRPGSVVSLHLGHPGTVAALPGILAGLRDRRLAAVTASQLLAVPA